MKNDPPFYAKNSKKFSVFVTMNGLVVLRSVLTIAEISKICGLLGELIFKVLLMSRNSSYREDIETPYTFREILPDVSSEEFCVTIGPYEKDSDSKCASEA